MSGRSCGITFSIEDVALIRQRRRNANRLGFAVHLAYLRFPGGVLGPNEADNLAEVREHDNDTGGTTEHVFGLCHLLGFRFAPRLRDLNDRRLYVANGRAEHVALDCLIGGVIIFGR